MEQNHRKYAAEIEEQAATSLREFSSHYVAEKFRHPLHHTKSCNPRRYVVSPHRDVAEPSTPSSPARHYVVCSRCDTRPNTFQSPSHFYKIIIRKCGDINRKPLIRRGDVNSLRNTRGKTRRTLIDLIMRRDSSN